MGRRVRKEVFIYDDGWPQDNDPDEQWHFVYDGWTLDTPRLAGRDGLHGSPGALPIAASQGWNVVMVLDGLNSNATTRKYTWGLDLSGSIHGAGGIGGLLSCEEPQAPGGPKRYWFLYDGNGNLTENPWAFNAGDGGTPTGQKYEYDEENQLVRVRRLSDNEILLEIAYDAFGRRVESKEYLDGTGQPLSPPRVTHHVVLR